MKHSKWYVIAKKNCEQGTWNYAMLQNVYSKKRITEDEFNELSNLFPETERD